MSNAADDVLLQFFSEDFGGPAQPAESMSVYALEAPQETPTSPLSWESVTPPSSPDAYLADGPASDGMELDAPDLAMFDSPSSTVSSSPLMTSAPSTASQLFDPSVSLSKAQVEAIAAAMGQPLVAVKPDPADMEQHVTPPQHMSSAMVQEELAKLGLSPDEYSSFDQEEEDLDELIDAAKAKRSRKKRKLTPTESCDVLPDDIDTLDQKALLQLSSRAFEEYVRRKTATRDLTPEEKKDLKRQRRLIKNRESAQASRQRKKNYIEKLEAKVASLSQANTQLRAQVAALTNETGSLKQEVSNLQGLIKKAPALQQLWTSGINYVASLAKQQKDEAANPSNSQPATTVGNNVKAAGVCLLVLLFSFGLFFPQTMSGNSALPFETPASQAIPDVVPTTTRLFTSKGSFFFFFFGFAFRSSLILFCLRVRVSPSILVFFSVGVVWF